MELPSDILCIHYYYPPIRSGGVLRNYYFSREFAKIFSNTYIITTSNVDVMEQECLEVPSNIQISKANTADYRSIKREGNHISTSVKSSWIFSFLIKLKKTLPFHFYIGEGGQKYMRSAVKIASRIIEERKVSHLYSSFMPYSDHKIASILKAKYPHLIWIADFRDLQNEPIYKNIFFPKWNNKIEGRLLKNANLITTISEGLAKTLKGVHPRVLSVPRGIEYNERDIKKYDKFTISYTGNLYQDYRDGNYFVKALKQFVETNNLQKEDIEFIYAGRDSRQWNLWFEDNNMEEFIHDKNYVSREESKEIQDKSHLLLLLSSSSEEQQGVLTGKLFEYLETNNPILNLINGIEDQEFEDVFTQLEAGKIFYPNQEDMIVDFLQQQYDQFLNDERNILSKTAVENRKAISWSERVKTLLNEA